MLMVAAILIVAWLEEYIPRALENLVFQTAEMMWMPVGLVLIVSLGLFLLLAVLIQRAMP